MEIMLTEAEPGGASLEFEGRPKEILEAIAAAIKETLYDVYLHHQSSIKKNKVRSTLRTRLQLTFVLVQTLQLVSVILEQCDGVSDYSQYGIIENVLVSLRVDLWAEKMGQVQIAVIVSLAVGVGSLIALGAEMVIVRFYPVTTLHPLLMLAADLPAAIVHRLLLLPMLLLYLKCLFDSLLVPRDSPYNSVWLGLLGGCGLLGFGGLILLRICFLYESSWSQRHQRMLARPSPTFELKEAAVPCIISVLVVLRKSSDLSVLATAGLCFYLLFELILFQPYYNSTTLLAKAIQYAGCTWVCLSLEAAIATNTMVSGICLVLFVSPCVGVLTACLQVWRKARIVYVRRQMPFWRFELCWRRVLKDYEQSGHEETVLECIKVGAKSHKQVKAYFLQIAQFYYYMKDLPEIALLRLSMTKGCISGIAIDFQIIRLSKAISRLSASEEREFVDYETNFMRARQLDQKLCECTCEVLNVLLNKSATNVLLERSFVTLSSVIQSAKDTYRRLKQRFPTDPFILEMYGSFVEELFHDKAGHDLITKGNFEKNRRKKTNINVIESYSSEDTGVMIISCDPDQFGKITYANEQLSSILRCKVHEIIGKDLDDFIPPPYNYKHNGKLTSFLSTGEAKEIFRKNLFLSSMGRFSVEVTFRFRPTAVNNLPYFVTAVRQKKRNREFALFNDNMEITSHSYAFKQILKLFPSNTNLIGVNLEAILPGISAKYKGRETDPFVYRHPDVFGLFGAMYSQVQLGSQTIRWLYLFTQVRDMDDLFATASGDTLKEVRNALNYSASLTSEEKVTQESSTVRPPSCIIEYQAKDRDLTLISSANLKDTRDDGSSIAPTHTSFAASTYGVSLRRRVLRAAKTYKVAYLVTMLVIATIVAINLAIVYTTFHSLTETNNISELGDTRHQIVKIVHLVRRLSFIKLGLEPESLQGLLAATLSAEIELLNEEVDRHLKSEKAVIPVWTHIRDSYELELEPLVTALSSFSTNAKLLADDPSDLNFGSDFYYVYCNGPSSILKSLNQTVNQSLANMRTSGFNTIATASTISFVLIAGVLLASSLFIARSLTLLRMIYKALWQCLVRLPITSIQETLQTHKERIECVHGDEYQLSEQTKVRNNPGMAVPPNNWVKLVLTTGAFVAITAGFVLFILVYGSAQVQLLFDSHTNYVNTKSLTVYLPTLALGLLEEAYLLRSSYPNYYSIVQEGQFSYSISVQLQGVLNTLAYFENNVLSDIAEITAASGSEYDTDLTLILENACPFVNSSIPLCQQSSLAKGQHAGMMEMRVLALDLARRVETGSAGWAEILALEGFVQVLTGATELTEEKVMSYTVATSQAFVNEMLIYSCSYVLASAGLYLFLYLPMITSLKTKCISVWRITTLIRRDLVVSKQ